MGSDADWHKVERLRTHEHVLAAIEDQIARGNLGPGDRLPSERALAEYLKVSRPSVREALRILEWMGVVATGVGSGKDAGSIIATRPSAALASLLRLFLGLAHFELSDLVETRIALESAAVTAAAERATAQDIEPVRTLIERMGDPSLEPGEFNDLDTEFHVAVATASGNQLLIELMRALRAAMRQAMVQAFERLPDWRATANELRMDHIAIIDAIEQRRGDLAMAAVANHISGFYRTVVADK